LLITIAFSVAGCRVAPTPNPSIHADLVPIGDSGITGTASIGEVGQGRLQAYVELSRFDAAIVSLEVRNGACDHPGLVVATLTAPEAGKSWTTLTGTLDQFLGLIVVVRSEAASDFLACGSLTSGA
jgi:hypothetical protein